MRRRRGLIGLVPLVVVVMLASTACLRTEVGVHLDDDGSGSVDVTVYFDDVTLQGGSIGVDDLVRLATAATKGVDGAEVSKVESAGSEGVRMSVPFDDYNQVARAVTGAEYQGYSTHVFQTFEIVKGDDGHWSMHATLDPAAVTSTVTQAPGPLAGMNAAATRVDPSTEIVLAVTLPGEVLRSNADIIDGGTATWNLRGDSGPKQLTVENQPSTLNVLQLLLIGVAAL
ncbi:MAG: hypothetical protein JST64_11635, partial [Actinobacteria bacterium]|nr:hypothetical protein [Actinomycetota bacterium]